MTLPDQDVPAAPDTATVTGGGGGSRKVVHLSRAARTQAGKDARLTAPLSAHAEFVTDGRADSIALLDSQAASRVAEARADPLRADGSHTVRVLPRRRADHGRRPGQDPELGIAGAVVR